MAIHTNAGGLGYVEPIAKVDIYVNGGSNQPGCLTILCSHERSFEIFAESLSTDNFVAVKCNSYRTAELQMCNGEIWTLKGDLTRINARGIYQLNTFSRPPFAQG